MEKQPTRYGGMRRFRLDRAKDPTGVSGTGCVAQGVVFSDGTVVVRWLGAHPTTTMHPNIESVEHIHGHGGATTIRWEDPICFACGATHDVAKHITWCSACGAQDADPPCNETRPPGGGTWVKAVELA